MTDKHDKLVEMALDAGFHAGKTISGQRYAYDGAGIDVTKELAAFAAAHVASLCADVKPWVWLVTGSRVFDDQVEFTQSKAEARIAERKDGSECVPLVPASTVASLTAQRDQALARATDWNRLYDRAINEANGLTNYVEDRPELRSVERRLDVISADARALKGQP